MKNIKKIILYITIPMITLISTGCAKDNMDNINITVTNYPNEYVIKALYGEHANIESTYPDGIDINTYKLSKKQKKSYSKTDLFVYTGLREKERNLALDLLSINSNLKIIDTSYVLETDYSPEELWLNPSSLLMMAQNIRIGLEEYITSGYLKDEIDENYNNLKLTLSELDATYRISIENAGETTIVVDNSALKYLEKFDLNVYCIDADATEKTISDVKNLIESKEISYIYTFNNEELSNNAKDLIDNYEVKSINLHRLDNLTDAERAEKKDYITIMENNLELIKQELYQ